MDLDALPSFTPKMFELHITSIPAMPDLDIRPTNQAVLAAPTTLDLLPHIMAVALMGGQCYFGPAGSFGNTSEEEVKLGLLYADAAHELAHQMWHRYEETVSKKFNARWN